MLKLKVDGMTCGHCAMRVKEALLGVEGVETAEVDLQRGEAVVQGGDAQALLKAVEAEGYAARLA